jgi:hypothetical protein
VATPQHGTRTALSVRWRARRYDGRGWRAVFFLSGFEHSLAADPGSAWARRDHERQFSTRLATRFLGSIWMILRRAIGRLVMSRQDNYGALRMPASVTRCASRFSSLTGLRKKAAKPRSRDCCS